MNLKNLDIPVFDGLIIVQYSLAGQVHDLLRCILEEQQSILE